MMASDEFSKHEILHTTHIISEMFNNYVVEHPALSGEDIASDGEELSKMIEEFYQKVAEWSLKETEK